MKLGGSPSLAQVLGQVSEAVPAIQIPPRRVAESGQPVVPLGPPIRWALIPAAPRLEVSVGDMPVNGANQAAGPGPGNRQTTYGPRRIDPLRPGGCGGGSVAGVQSSFVNLSIGSPDQGREPTGGHRRAPPPSSSITGR